MTLAQRIAAAYRAFQGDRWSDPKYVNECDGAMAACAMAGIHRLLDEGGIPRGSFVDDHVRNLVALYNQRGARIKELEALLASAAVS